MPRPYETLPFGTCILRDHLAMDRTILANERTLLAYVRTAFATIVAGLSFLQFFEGTEFLVIGWICVVVGLGIFALGGYRFQKMSLTRHFIDVARRVAAADNHLDDA